MCVSVWSSSYNDLHCIPPGWVLLGTPFVPNICSLPETMSDTTASVKDGILYFNVGGDHYLCDVGQHDAVRDGTEWSCSICFDNPPQAEGPVLLGFDACNECYKNASESVHEHKLVQGCYGKDK